MDGSRICRCRYEAGNSIHTSGARPDNRAYERAQTPASARRVWDRHARSREKPQYTSRTYRFSRFSVLTYSVAPSASKPPCSDTTTCNALSTSFAIRVASPQT